MKEHFTIQPCDGVWYVIYSDETIAGRFDNEDDAADKCLELNMRANGPSRCKFCNSETDVEFGPDPYSVEIYNDYEMHWLCHGCINSRAEEV